MPIEAQPTVTTGRRRRLLVIGVSALSVGIIAGAWLLSIGEPEIEPSPATALVSSASVEPQHTPAVNVEQASPPAQSDFLHDVALRPEEVLGNLECTVMPGRGAASDTAIVVLRTETGARFSVVDGRGTVVSDNVPFRPHHYRLGKRNDGTPLVGLGDLRLNSKTSRPVDSPEPMRIYLGKQLVYESEKAWDFIVAHDGSSFAVHEPLAGDGSRLVVHDLDRSEERHFDLGTRMTPVNAYEREHMIAYTLDGTEIMFHPSDGDAMGVGTYWFYPVGDGPTRRITVEGGRSAFLISSREGYFTEQPEDLKPDEYPGVSQVTRRRFDAASNTTDDRWSRRLDLNRFDGTISLSDNGRWLSVDGWDFHVLDAESGDTVFKYPRGAIPSSNWQGWSAWLERTHPLLTWGA